MKKSLFVLFVSFVCSVCYGQTVTVKLSSVTPTTIKAGKEVIGAQFIVDAESVKNGSSVQFFLWEVNLRVSSGDALDLGSITVVDESGRDFAWGKVFRFASQPNPLGALVHLVAPFPPSLVVSRHLSMEKKSFSLVFETTEAFVGADITVISVSLVGFDYGYPGLAGEMVAFEEPVATTVRVEQPSPPPSAILTVSVSPSTPTSVSPSDASVVARFQVTAKSIRPGNSMLWRGWDLHFEVSAGAISSLGDIKVINEAGAVIREQVIIPRGDNPRYGIVALTELDNGVSGYHLKEVETLTVVCSTSALEGKSLSIISVELLAADMGSSSNPKYGDLVLSQTEVSTTVRVEQSTPTVVPIAPSTGSVGGGGGGPGPGVVVPQPPPEPRPPSELPGREIALQEAPWYRRGPLPAGGNGWWCFVRLTEPFPEKAAVWWDSEWSGQYPVPMVGVNGDGTLIGFPLVYNIGHLTEGRLGEIGRVRVFELPGP